MVDDSNKQQNKNVGQGRGFQQEQTGKPDLNRDMQDRKQERVGQTPNRTGSGETSTSGVSSDDLADPGQMDTDDKNIDHGRKGVRDSGQDINS